MYDRLTSAEGTHTSHAVLIRPLTHILHYLETALTPPIIAHFNSSYLTYCTIGNGPSYALLLSISTPIN